MPCSQTHRTPTKLVTPAHGSPDGRVLVVVVPVAIVVVVPTGEVVLVVLPGRVLVVVPIGAVVLVVLSGRVLVVVLSVVVVTAQGESSTWQPAQRAHADPSGGSDTSAVQIVAT
jgi:hypothetical protein